jgi:hypothetical protein
MITAVITTAITPKMNERHVGREPSALRVGGCEHGRHALGPAADDAGKDDERDAIADAVFGDQLTEPQSFADGVIAFYDAKYHYTVWRPITAIRLGDTIGNPAITGDPSWTPLASTPADPSFPGAHSTISEAGATILSAFYGAGGQIEVSSDVLPGTVRQFDGYQAITTEAGLSRIFAGVHTRLDHEAGLTLGRDVAQLVLRSSKSADFGANSRAATPSAPAGRYSSGY